MDGLTVLGALQALHRELLALREGFEDTLEALDSSGALQVFEEELRKVWEHPKQNEKSRCQVASGQLKLVTEGELEVADHSLGKLSLNGEEYSVNDEFQQNTFLLSDELNLDAIEAAKCLLESQDDPAYLGRPLLECAIVRFHQQRKYVLDSVRLFLELGRVEEDAEESRVAEVIDNYIAERIFQTGANNNLVARCLSAMTEIRTWLQKVGDKLTAAQTLGLIGPDKTSSEVETVEFSRGSLIQQHEAIAVILNHAIEKRQCGPTEFSSFLESLKKVDRYDILLVHQIPAIGAFISIFGSTEGDADLVQARQLDVKLFSNPDNRTWSLQYLQAAVRAWWIAEYSGFYLDEPPGAAIPPGTDLDMEDRQRSKHFTDALKDGAFDFLLAIAGDVKSPDWHDSVRTGMRKWLQRKSPALMTDSVHFCEFFQSCLMGQLQVFVDAFISNLPDVLRKLRVEEDEQRQLSQAHEQDLDLERFLLVIAYAYEDRTEEAANFWSDPDSNLAGFMHWASRRASTPLVAAFCEMLQSISGNDECATAAHEFLLDEGHHSSGKMGRSQSLTWSQIFKELDFFSDKIKQKPTASNTSRYRSGKLPSDVVEAEPESAMMLECYLRLITKLVSQSEPSRQFLLRNDYTLIARLLDLASCHIPSRLRGCIFLALKAMLTRKTNEESFAMWSYLDNWLAGAYANSTGAQQRPAQQQILASVDRTLEDVSAGFEDPESFVQLLLSLVTPSSDTRSLNDALPFPEDLGSAFRSPGIDIYVDFAVRSVFSTKLNELQDIYQTRVLRLSCLDFIHTCISTFNEDLIILANKTSLPVDAIIATTDLATYVQLHPFSRVMEWLFNDKVMNSLFNTIQQSPLEVGNAAPDSPLVLGALRAVEIVSLVLDCQATYLDLVRPMTKKKSTQRRLPVANAAYASFDDGLLTRINLVVTLGSFCGLGHPQLTLASLKLLEKISSSPKITSAWSGSRNERYRNKAIVAMEANGENEAIFRAMATELVSPLEASREGTTPNYASKVYILDFLYECLKAGAGKPTIAHLLLGFKCGVDSISVDSNGAFTDQTSLFHSLLKLFFETPTGDNFGMRGWLIRIKCRIIRILRVLWSSPLSSSIVIEELRGNDFLFHLLLREAVMQPEMPWDGQGLGSPDFLVTDGASTLLDFLTLRSTTFDYIALELCTISQSRMPSIKRRIFEALGGQVIGDGQEAFPVPTIFDLYDFLLPDDIWAWVQPELNIYNDLDFSSCLQEDADGNEIYDVDLAREIILLKRPSAAPGALISAQDLAAVEAEEAQIEYHLVSLNRQRQIASQGLTVLKTWTKLLLVMVECNDFKGTEQTSFFLQALQSILPTLEAFASDRPDEASELARLAKTLLFKLNLTMSKSGDDNNQAVGHLVGDKLYQLFQICLQAIGKWAGGPELRSMYYEICFRFLAGISEQGPLSSSRAKSIKTIHLYGERLINVICDDATGAEPACQTAALILLNSLVVLEREEGEVHVIEILNKLNFVGIMVDSLKDILSEWHAVFASGTRHQKNFQNARLALLLQLAQTRSGAKYILYANLFRSVENSGLFIADPELQADLQNPQALEQHYDLLAQIVRIIGAAIVSRGNHNTVQGRKFLTDNRMLVSHTLKRSVGIGGTAEGGERLEEKILDLADAFMIVITATGFLEFEESVLPESKPQQSQALFH